MNYDVTMTSPQYFEVRDGQTRHYNHVELKLIKGDRTGATYIGAATISRKDARCEVTLHDLTGSGRPDFPARINTSLFVPCTDGKAALRALELQDGAVPPHLKAKAAELTKLGVDGEQMLVVAIRIATNTPVAGVEKTVDYTKVAAILDAKIARLKTRSVPEVLLLDIDDVAGQITALGGDGEKIKGLVLRITMDRATKTTDFPKALQLMRQKLAQLQAAKSAPAQPAPEPVRPPAPPTVTMPPSLQAKAAELTMRGLAGAKILQLAIKISTDRHTGIVDFAKAEGILDAKLAETPAKVDTVQTDLIVTYFEGALTSARHSQRYLKVRSAVVGTNIAKDRVNLAMSGPTRTWMVTAKALGAALPKLATTMDVKDYSGTFELALFSVPTDEYEAVKAEITQAFAQTFPSASVSLRFPVSSTILHAFRKVIDIPAVDSRLNPIVQITDNQNQHVETALQKVAFNIWHARIVTAGVEAQLSTKVGAAGTFTDLAKALDIKPKQGRYDPTKVDTALTKAITKAKNAPVPADFTRVLASHTSATTIYPQQSMQYQGKTIRFATFTAPGDELTSTLQSLAHAAKRMGNGTFVIITHNDTDAEERINVGEEERWMRARNAAVEIETLRPILQAAGINGYVLNGQLSNLPEGKKNLLTSITVAHLPKPLAAPTTEQQVNAFYNALMLEYDIDVKAMRGTIDFSRPDPSAQPEAPPAEELAEQVVIGRAPSVPQEVNPAPRAPNAAAEEIQRIFRSIRGVKVAHTKISPRDDETQEPMIVLKFPLSSTKAISDVWEEAQDHIRSALLFTRKQRPDNDKGIAAVATLEGLVNSHGEHDTRRLAAIIEEDTAILILLPTGSRTSLELVYLAVRSNKHELLKIFNTKL